jgi:rhodanese-related sulfurtransferase
MAQTTAAVKEIERDELKAKIDRGEAVALLETLAPEHFQHAHLPGAVNMPPDRVKELGPLLVPDKHTEVITPWRVVQMSVAERRRRSAAPRRRREDLAIAT